jgi:hypothetical protein
MTTTPPTNLCRVCIQRPAGSDGVCDTCRPWHTDAPVWTEIGPLLINDRPPRWSSSDE